MVNHECDQNLPVQTTVAEVPGVRTVRAVYVLNIVYTTLRERLRLNSVCSASCTRECICVNVCDK